MTYSKSLKITSKLQKQTVQDILEAFIEQRLDNKWTYEEREVIEDFFTNLKSL